MEIQSALEGMPLPAHDGRGGKVFISDDAIQDMGPERAAMLLAEVKRRGLWVSHDNDRREWCIFREQDL